MARWATRILMAMCLLGTAAARADETRVALVIGNSAYESVPRLDNPGRDAAIVAETLKKIGFQTVELKSDIRNEALRKALQDFATLADKADWAVVYYAGHGIEIGGINYLLPVDAKLKSDRDVSFEGVTLDSVLASLEGARKLRLVILDACRDNPFLLGMKRSLASRSVGRGLGRVEPELGGTLVAYAAKAGQVAADDVSGTNNSPYAAALVRNLVRPDVEVEFMFRQVRADVLAATGGRQDPATYGALPPERFVFLRAGGSPRPAEKASPPATQAAALPTPPVTAGTDRAALLLACDRLAARPTEPDKPLSLPGVAIDDIDTAKAIPACEAAYAAAPDEKRVVYQLGRAHEAARHDKESVRYYEKAAHLGHIAGMNDYGVALSQGRGIPLDYAEGRRWIRKCAETGTVECMFNLGMIYQRGIGTAPDRAEARSWLGKAAAQGDPEAKKQLAKLRKRQR